MSEKAIDRLSKEILDEALSEKDSILKEAEKTAGEILKDAEAEKKKRTDSAQEEVKTYYSQTLENLISSAAAENKDEMLSEKLKLVDSIIEEVRKGVSSISKKQMKSFLKKEMEDMPLKEGEYLIGLEEDKVDEEMLKEIFKGRKIVQSKKKADFKRGVKILSNKVVYTLSPESRLESMIDRIKMEISGSLFRGGND